MSSRGTAEGRPLTFVDCHIISSIGYLLKPFNMDQFRYRKVMIKRKCNECTVILWKILGECLEMYHHIAKKKEVIQQWRTFVFSVANIISEDRHAMRDSRFSRWCCMIFEYWSTRFLRNVRNYSRNDTVSHSIRSELLHHVVYCVRSLWTFQKILSPSSEYMLGGGLIMKAIESSETPVFLCGTAWHYTQKEPLLISLITSYGSFVRTL